MVAKMASAQTSTSPGTATAGIKAAHEGHMQFEAWEDEDGCRFVMVAATGASSSVAWSISNDPRIGLWEVASGAMPRTPGKLDPRKVARSLEWCRASSYDMAVFGLMGGPPALPDWVEATLDLDASRLPVLQRAFDAGASRNDAGIPFHPIGSVSENGAVPEAFGFATHRQRGLIPAGRHEARGGPALLSASGSDADDGEASDGPRRLKISWLIPVDASTADVRDLAADHVRWISGYLPRRRDLATFPILGREWQASTHAFYAVPGDKGLRRRQAAALHPAFATVIATRKEVSALVDDGQPYEEALATSLRPLVAGKVADRMTAALAKRLRTLPPMEFKELGEVLGVAVRLPVDWIPRKADEWKALRNVGTKLVWDCELLGLDLAHLVHRVSGHWGRIGPTNAQGCPVGGSAEAGVAARVIMSSASDMASRFHETLVGKLPASAGCLPYESNMVAGAVLFGGKSLPAIDQVQARWHLGLGAFEATLPQPAGINAWPASFEPFRASNGLEIVCLTDEAQLRAEGGKGPDAQDVDGLNHCVGGYGRRCYSGICHVASVRRVSGDGFERLSTIELVPVGTDPATASLAIKQHHGRSNAQPVSQAAEAVSEFMAALDAGLHSLDRAALTGRSERGFVDYYIEMDEAMAETAFAAWKPYLPRDIARGGVSALQERIRQEIVRLGIDPDPFLEEPFGMAP
jgi:hypothetical protein